MGYASLLGLGYLIGDDREAVVELHGVGVDNLASETSGQFNG